MAVLFENIHSDPLLIFFVQLALTLALTRVLGKAFSYMDQPMVIGEVVAGVIMGPSVMGRIPGFTQAVWPTAVPQGGGRPPYDSTITFSVIADMGVVLFMFLLGCELDHHRQASQWRTALPIAIAAILFPFCVGAANGLWLEGINNEDQPPGFVPPRHRSFLLFAGTSMSFSAFPVLASILSTLKMLSSPLGLQALSCAAVDDVLAWCVLALASSFSQSNSALQGLYTTIGAVVYVAVMVGAVRPLLARAHRRVVAAGAADSPYYMTALFLLLIASAFCTEALGIHAFFGSFVMGLCVPKDDGFAAALAGRMELVVTDVLLPLFFASSGIKTDLGTLDTPRYWGVVVALTAIATASKVLPGCLVGKVLLKGRPWRFCLALGVLLNTRGLVELIALNIALSMGILTTRMFSMFVLMAIATTWMTGPCIALLYRGRREELLEGLPPQGGPAGHQQLPRGGRDASDATAAPQPAGGGSTSEHVAGSGAAAAPLSPASSVGSAVVTAKQRPSSVTLIYTRPSLGLHGSTAGGSRESWPGVGLPQPRRAGSEQWLQLPHKHMRGGSGSQALHGAASGAVEGAVCATVAPASGSTLPPGDGSAAAGRGAPSASPRGSVPRRSADSGAASVTGGPRPDPLPEEPLAVTVTPPLHDGGSERAEGAKDVQMHPRQG